MTCKKCCRDSPTIIICFSRRQTSIRSHFFEALKNLRPLPETLPSVFTLALRTMPPKRQKRNTVAKRVTKQIHTLQKVYDAVTRHRDRLRLHGGPELSQTYATDAVRAVRNLKHRLTEETKAAEEWKDAQKAKAKADNKEDACRTNYQFVLYQPNPDLDTPNSSQLTGSSYDLASSDSEYSDYDDIEDDDDGDSDDRSNDDDDADKFGSRLKKKATKKTTNPYKKDNKDDKKDKKDKKDNQDKKRASSSSSRFPVPASWINGTQRRVP